MTIYAVMGSTGQYSDFREWPVAAYADKLLAEEHCRLATQYAVSAWRGGYTMAQLVEIGKNNVMDPGGDIDIDTQYAVVEIELRTELPRV